MMLQSITLKSLQLALLQITEKTSYETTEMNLCTYESVICAIRKQTGPFDFDVVLKELMQQFPGEREDSLRSILAQVWKRKPWKKFFEGFVIGISKADQTGLQGEP